MILRTAALVGLVCFPIQIVFSASPSTTKIRTYTITCNISSLYH